MEVVEKMSWQLPLVAAHRQVGVGGEKYFSPKAGMM